MKLFTRIKLWKLNWDISIYLEMKRESFRNSPRHLELIDERLKELLTEKYKLLQKLNHG